jgi:hypothetical protein
MPQKGICHRCNIMFECRGDIDRDTCPRCGQPWDDAPVVKKPRYVTLYHGTPVPNRVLREGLHGGDNSNGGTHGFWDTPRLFTSPKQWVAAKYGTVIRARIPYGLYKRGDRLNDGLGDECCVFEGEGILIPAKYLNLARRLDPPWE